jgi:hypothetical protein
MIVVVGATGQVLIGTTHPFQQVSVAGAVGQTAVRRTMEPSQQVLVVGMVGAAGQVLLIGIMEPSGHDLSKGAGPPLNWQLS